ncbi:MAG: TrmB family transcriptional regulator [Lachnospiraceae bacterium]|nr:TrmB family transcriptional regulator [Lachnospiraceae bacterium]MBQ6994737.1 TrmB family transcriptional regulator [Lachnospiraceae bacterium]
MEEATLIDKLLLFGLTRQEAVIYLCLAAHQELSGYEVSKITGISRSNVYNALASLVEEGAAYLLEGSTNKYTAVDVEEFCDNKIRHLQKTKDELVRDMPQNNTDCEGYITISGHKHIMDKVHYMLTNVQYRIYVSMPVEFLEKCREDIERLLEKGKKVVLIVSETIDFPGAIIYLTDKKEQQIRFIVDSEYVLTGDMSGRATDTCLYCGQKNFVNVFKESMKNEIKLIELQKHYEKSERNEIV